MVSTGQLPIIILRHNTALQQALPFALEELVIWSKVLRIFSIQQIHLSGFKFIHFLFAKPFYMRA